MLIAQNRMSVDVFQLNAAGNVVELVSVGARFAIEELYLDVELVANESIDETQN